MRLSHVLVLLLVIAAYPPMVWVAIAGALVGLAVAGVRMHFERRKLDDAIGTTARS